MIADVAPRDEKRPFGTNADGSRIRYAEDALGRLRERVNATHAHEHSLLRAGRGIQTVGRDLHAVLAGRVQRSGWTPEYRLAQAAFEALEQQLAPVLEGEGTWSRLSMEQRRTHLNHAWFRAIDMAILLRD